MDPHLAGSSAPDSLARALLGAGLLMLGVLASVPLSLVHVLAAFGEVTASGAGRLRTAWLVCAACIALGALVLGDQVDGHVAPFLLPAASIPIAITASAWRLRNELSDGAPLGRFDRWSLRLGPVVWLALFAYFVVVVFPKT